MWVGTRTGIGRFDGYELKKYLHDNITHLFEDNENKIWAVTAKGLYYYNESDDNFLQAKDKKNSIHFLPPLSVHGQTEFYLADTERFINTTMLTGKRNCFAPCNPTITIISLPCENGDKHTLLAINRWKNALLIDIRTGKTQPAPFKSDDLTDCFIDSKGNVWTAPYHQGVKNATIATESFYMLTTR